MKKLIENLMKKKLLAFSLVETSIVLMVAGIIIGISFKGIELIDKAKIQSTSSDIMTFLYSFENDSSSSDNNINHKTKVGAKLQIESNSNLSFLTLKNNDNSYYKFSGKFGKILIKNLVNAGLEEERIVVTNLNNEVTSIENNDEDKKYYIKLLIK